MAATIFFVYEQWEENVISIDIEFGKLDSEIGRGGTTQNQ